MKKLLFVTGKLITGVSLFFVSTTFAPIHAETLFEQLVREDIDRQIQKSLANSRSKSQCDGMGTVYLYTPSKSWFKCEHPSGKCAAIYYNSKVYRLDGGETILTLADLPELELLRCITTEEMASVKYPIK